jgi:hypothetical protein
MPGFNVLDWVRLKGKPELWRVQAVGTAPDGTEPATCRSAASSCPSVPFPAPGS